MISELQQLEESALAELETARTEDQFTCQDKIYWSQRAFNRSFKKHCSGSRC